MIKDINVRFFSYCTNEAVDPDICEITEGQFKELEGVITYERHTVRENGCRQICLTIEPNGYPYFDDLERV
jgi:hypothetical protein